MNCAQSLHAELLLFDDDINSLLNSELVPNDSCFICANNLLEMSGISTCCGNYSKPLKCGHWTHINCQVNKKHNNICSLCDYELIKEEDLEKILQKYK